MIKLVCFDFDGVFTDGKIYYDSDNNAIKYYNVRDGCACMLLQTHNIKTGIITAFNSDSIKINDKPIQNIINHLKFDYVSVGQSGKLDILKKWVAEMDIEMSQVAYIGDDISDIPVLQSVGFSACPNDAIDQCKEVVNYICQKNGSEGCVREFVDRILNEDKESDLISSIKKEAIFQLNYFPEEEIDMIIDLLKNHFYNIYFTGIGKSENIAIHCANLLKCIGINAFYLNCSNSLHGDIGTVSSNDIVFLFSKSGNTKELLQLLDFLNKRKCYNIGICCNKNNKLQDSCNKVIVLPLNNEIQGNIQTIPTNSYMAQMFFCNILVTKLSKIINISIEQYKNNHPAGNIGNKLKTINDVLIYEFPRIMIDESNSNVFIKKTCIYLNDIMLEMTRYSIGCCFFINNDNKLLGLLTDGDIRRLLLTNKGIDKINIDHINTKYHYEMNGSKLLIDIKDGKKSKFIPLIVYDKLIGIIDYREMITP